MRSEKRSETWLFTLDRLNCGAPDKATAQEQQSEDETRQTRHDTT